MAHIITATGISGFVSGQTFSVSSTHPRYGEILNVLNRQSYTYDDISQLINMTHMIEQAAREDDEFNDIKINHRMHTISIAGDVLDPRMTSKIVKLIGDGGNVSYLLRFVRKVADMPRSLAVRVYDWIEANNMPITEDGNIIAFKRVRDDMMSFHDSMTEHAFGQYTTLSRSLCDDDNNHTCSSGLHFCSESYLPGYHGGQGRALVVEVDPRDIVAIPIEYGTQKGRCCRYKVLSELTSGARKQVEQSQPIMQMVTLKTDEITHVATTTMSFMVGYTDGYKAGKVKSHEDTGHFALNGEYNRGYAVGYKDGRGHKTRLYNATFPVKE